MAPQRKPRDKFSFFENENPITDLHQILDILSPTRGDSIDGRYINIRNEIPEIHIGWYIHGDSGGDRSGIDYYQVDAGVVKKLIAEGWVVPKEVSRWGATDIHHHELVLSAQGKEELRHYYKSEEENARKMVEPGVHTKFSGVLYLRDKGRGYRSREELFFVFDTPMNERVRVYPLVKRVEKVK